jgi:hypothetical protein
MPAENDSLVVRVQSSYRKLADVATELNSVSDTLGQMIADLDAALKRLSLGLTVWVPFRSWLDEESYQHYSEDIGYAKVGGKWGIALRTVEGNMSNPDRDSIEIWLFNDSPRQMRLDSIAYIPTLLEKLSEHAVKTTKEIVEKLEATKDLVNAVKEAAAEPQNTLPSKMRTRPITGGQK